jgi:hypothetical protein
VLESSPRKERFVEFFAKPGVAIGFGAFFLCAETCLHAEEVLQFATRPLELPVYEWTAGGFLLIARISDADI